MTLIILEGPDGVGKTTLARELRRRLAPKSELETGGVAYIHKGPPTTNHLLREYLLPIADYRADAKTHLILDRWHVGELVYPELSGDPNRRSLATPEDLAYLSLWLRSRGALVCYAFADPKTVVEWRTQRGESTTLDSVNREFEAFDDAFGVDGYLGIYTGAATGALVDSIISEARRAADEVARIAKFTTYVGPPEPSVLLLGDERNPARFDYGGFTTAFAPMPMTSGLYLSMAIPRDDLIGGRIGIANANEGDNPLALWHALGRPSVVALGTRAYDGCVRANLPDATLVGAVPHPQFTRRFHYGRCIEYGELIMRAAETGEDLRKWPTSA